jgi:hypothetical protein
MFERVLRWRKRSTDGKREERRAFGGGVMGRSAKEALKKRTLVGRNCWGSGSS